MPALLPIVLAASHLVLAADSVPKFGVERTCRPAAVAGVLPGRDSAACQRDEVDARGKLEQEMGPIQRGTEEPVRRICRTRSRTELRGVAHLPGNGKAGTRTSARLESGNRGPQVTVSSSFRVDYKGWRTSPASATACMPIAVWACPYRPLASFFPSPNASDLSP